MSDWRHKLNKTERKHLREMAIHTPDQLRKARKVQTQGREGLPDGCWDCHFIAQKLGME